MVISITLTYCVALLVCVCETLSDLCIGTPHNFHDLNSSSPRIISPTAYTARSGLFKEKHAEIHDDFQRTSSSHRGNYATRTWHTRRCVIRVIIFLLFHADIADRKGKLNSPAANAANFILCVWVYFITRQGKRKKRQGTVAKSTDDYSNAKKEARKHGDKKGKKEKDTKVIFNAFEYQTGVPPKQKRLTRRHNIRKHLLNSRGEQRRYIARSSVSEYLLFGIVRHVFPPSTMIDNRLRWCKFACTRAAYINDNGCVSRANRARARTSHSRTLGSDVHGQGWPFRATCTISLRLRRHRHTLSSRRCQANRSWIPDMFARVIKPNYNYSERN